MKMNSPQDLVLEFTGGKDNASVTCQVFSEIVECPTDLFIDIDLGGIEEIPSKNIIDTFVQIVPSPVGSSGGVGTEVHLDMNISSEPMDSSSNSSNSCKSSKITISGYACFVQHERGELVKINPKGKLRMPEVNKKWAKLSHEEKEAFNEIASNLKLIGRKPVVNAKLVKVKALKKKIKKSDDSYDVLNNREFVQRYEELDLKTEELDERNKKLSEANFGLKLRILKKSQEKKMRNENEATYKMRYQKLLMLHNKCIKSGM